MARLSGDTTMPEKHNTPANLDANQYYLKPFRLRAFGNVVRGLFIGAALGAGIVLFGLVSVENKGVSVVQAGNNALL
jgi:hypothetical protein